jgi:predicted lipid-binding transport protein (Tim44 family)
MTDDTLGSPTPQFGTAEYVGSPATDHCQYCHQPVPGTYYRINDAMACPACAARARGELAKDSHAAYVRGLLFGVGAAIAGLILYATFAITTGIIIGYVSLAVGWMVGTAITKGSRGIGGRRYQIAAAILTYAAVSMAAVPIWIHYAGKNKQSQQEKVRTERQKVADEQRRLETEFGQQHQNSTSPDSVAPPPAKEPAEVKPNFVGAVAQLLLVGIASPFLELWEGGPNFSWLIGVVILVVGIRIAWRITAAKPLAVYGPFENSAQLTP